MKNIKYSLKSEKQIDIVFSSFFENFFDYTKSRKITERFYFIIDKNVFKFYQNELLDVIQKFPNSSKYILKSKESNKTIDSAQDILQDLIKNSYGRDTFLVAIGGGIVGDLSGFVASIYARGIKLAHVPTTLLAIVDSSIGGKTGINFGETKNLVGTFYHPEFIFTDTYFLNSLAKEEIISGFGELFKYGILNEKSYFNKIKTIFNKILIDNSVEIPQKIIQKAVEMKINIVKNDEKESGMRQILNLGHTFAHAYEIITNHKITHGKAVLLGLFSASRLSEIENLPGINLSSQIAKIIQKVDFGADFPKIEMDEIFTILLRDKKNRGGKIKFVLPINFGELVVGFESEQANVELAIIETFNLVKK